MSKKFRAGRRKSQVQPNTFSSKRRGGAIRKLTYGRVEQKRPPWRDEGFKCAECGQVCIFNYSDQPHERLCFRCAIYREP